MLAERSPRAGEESERAGPSAFRSRALLLFAVLWVLIGSTAHARPKKDVVRLRNGDRITCEIKTLSRGMLTVGTDGMGTISIKWDEVASISSDFYFTVEDTAGVKYVGMLQPGSTPHQLSVSGDRSSDDLPHDRVVVIVEFEKKIWRRISGSVDSGFSYSKASNRSQFNFAGDVGYVAERYAGSIEYNSTVGTSQGEQDVNRESLNFAGALSVGRRWIAFSQLLYDHNLELDLDRRYSFRGGPGYKLAQSNRSKVVLLGGAAFTRESYFGQDSTKNAEGILGINAQFFKLYSPKVDITNQAFLIPSFTTGGRYRLELSSKFRVEILKDFFATVTFYDTYDSKPPSSGASSNDYGLTTGLSWSFRK